MIEQDHRCVHGTINNPRYVIVWDDFAKEAKLFIWTEDIDTSTVVRWCYR